MAVPIPSFFKIRLVLIIVGLLVVFFVLGLVKNVFAAWPGECTMLIRVDTTDISLISTVDGQSWGTVRVWHGVDSATGNFIPISSYSLPGYPTTSYDYFTSSAYIPVYSYYFENGSWIQQDILAVSSGAYWEDLSFLPPIATVLPTSCPEPCVDEIAALEAECGADYYAIDLETCEGHCLPDTGDCLEKYNALQERCGATGIKFWNNDLCYGECNDDCVKDSGEEAYISWCMYTHCAGPSNVASLVYQEDTDQYGCITVSKKECICKEDPPDGDCDAYRIQVDNTCGGSAFVAAYYCKNDDWDNRYYECMYPEDPPTPPEATPDPIDPNNPPDAPDEPDATEPDPTDSNALLAKIEDNTQSTVQNTKLIVERLDNTNIYLDNIADNQYVTAENTGKIVDALNDIKKDGLKLDDSKIVKGLDSLEDEIEGISGGAYSAAPLGEAYTNEKEGNIFSDRLDQFFQNVRQTGLFSLADSLTANIPTSGTSTMTIEAGQYGTHQFDFASWGNALLVLRYVLLTVFGWVAIRIVLLKR